MSDKLMALINLNEDKILSKTLLEDRPLACLPIAGRYRVIDFILSNISNSGIGNVGVLAQRKTRSLYDHLGDGSPWDLDTLKDGLFIFSKQYEINEKFVRGDISTMYENRDFLERSVQDYILITTPDMIFSIDFKEVFDSHLASGKDITVVYSPVNNADRNFYKCSTISIEDSIVKGIGANLCSKKDQNILLGSYIMRREDFKNLILESIETGQDTYISDAILKKVINSDKVNLYKFEGYVKYMQSVRCYIEFARDILNPDISKELFKNPKNLIYTKIKDEAPTYFSDDSKVENSIISSGSIIEGTVKNSVLSRRVKVEKGAVVENCIIMQNTLIEENSYLMNVITDKNTIITHGVKMIGDSNMPIVIKKGETI